jgi:hypothetical protein
MDRQDPIFAVIVSVVAGLLKRLWLGSGREGPVTPETVDKDRSSTGS